MRRFELALPHGTVLACRASAETDVGSSDAPRVMLLHGFPEAAFIWDGVIAALGNAARCVAPNLRGYPGSSAPPDVSAYRPGALVRDIVAAIESIGAPVDLLVAHDWGGAVAWNLAAARPDLLRRLLIVNAPHPAAFLRDLRHDPAQQAASAYMNFLCRPDAAASLSADGYRRLWRFIGPAPWLTSELRQVYEAGWGAAGEKLEGPLNYYRASPLRPSTEPGARLHTLELADEAVTVQVPTTVLWGERDTALLPGLLRGLEHWVPRLDVQRVADAGHWLVHERPERVISTIRSLLAKA